MATLKTRTLARANLWTWTEAEIQALILAARRELIPEFNDESSDDPITQISDMIAYQMGWSPSHQEDLAQELHPWTASGYEGMAWLARSAGIEIRQETPAAGTLRLTAASVSTQDRTYGRRAYQYTTQRAGSSDPIAYEADEDVVLPAGRLTVDFAATQGTSVVNENMGNGDGLGLQIYTSDQGRAIQGSAIVEVEETDDNWTTWTEVDSFRLSASTDRHFMVWYNEDASARILCGDGVRGKVFPAGRSRRVTYRVLDGRSGNAAAGTITRTVPTVSGITVSNPAAFDDYLTRQSLDELRVSIPAVNLSGDRCIAGSDYETRPLGPDGVAGVGRIIATFGTFGVRTVLLRVVSSAGIAAAPTKATEVRDWVDLRNHPREIVFAAPALFQSPAITADVALLGGYTMATELDDDGTTLEEALDAALDTELSALTLDLSGSWRWTPGSIVRLVHLERALNGVEGVDYAKVTGPAADFQLTAGHLPARGTTTYSVI